MHFQMTSSGEETTIHHTASRSFSLYQRRFQQKRGDTIPLHWHRSFQLVWVEEGTFHYTIDSQKIDLGPHEGIIINSQIIHGAQMKTAHIRYSCFDFSPYFINDHHFSQVVTTIIEHSNLCYQRLSFTEEQRFFLSILSWPLTNMQQLQVYDLFTSAILQLAQSAMQPQKIDDPIYHLLAFVQTHYQEPLTVSAIAKAGAISPHICTKLFRTYTSFTPIDYVIDYRLTQAKTALLETNDPVTDICFRVGFRHLSYFSHRFRQKYSLTPLAFRKKMRNVERPTS